MPRARQRISRTPSSHGEASPPRSNSSRNGESARVACRRITRGERGSRGSDLSVTTWCRRRTAPSRPSGRWRGSVVAGRHDARALPTAAGSSTSERPTVRSRCARCLPEEHRRVSTAPPASTRARSAAHGSNHQDAPVQPALPMQSREPVYVSFHIPTPDGDERPDRWRRERDQVRGQQA